MSDWLTEASRKYQRVVDEIEAGAAFEDYSLITLTTLYLIACYLYYEMMAPPLSDEKFDALCKYLCGQVDELEGAGVWHAELFERESLAAGTGYHLSGNYSVAVKNIAFYMGRV